MSSVVAVAAYLHHAHTVLPAQHPLVTQEWWEYSSFDDNVNDERLDSTASRVAWQQLVQDSADGTWLGNDSALWWAMLRHLQQCGRTQRKAMALP